MAQIECRFANRRLEVACVQSMMKSPDIATSHVKKRHCLMLTVQSSSNDRDESMCPSGAFHLNCYNSPYQCLRLNRFKLNFHLIRCCHIPASK